MGQNISPSMFKRKGSKYITCHVQVPQLKKLIAIDVLEKQIGFPFKTAI